MKNHEESNYTTWRLAKMNLANPPFNVSDRGSRHQADDKRRQYGVPPAHCSKYSFESVYREQR